MASATRDALDTPCVVAGRVVRRGLGASSPATMGMVAR
jgi:hypothetical protein